MWECKWKKLRKTVKLPTKYLYPLEQCYRLTEKTIIDAIENGVLFGAAEVDIEVPEELKERFEEMTPIFKNAKITANDIGPYMTEFLKETGESFKERRNLIGSMFGKKILLITPLLQWYLKNGLVVSKLYQFVQFNAVPCFKSFADKVSDDRRAGKLHG